MGFTGDCNNSLNKYSRCIHLASIAKGCQWADCECVNHKNEMRNESTDAPTNTTEITVFFSTRRLIMDVLTLR